MADRSIAPVVLPGWPSSEDNLAWADDYLAVATGESIHILALPYLRDQANLGYSYQLTDTIRVNQFTEEEWPIVDLAPLNTLSLGEEQSQSSVCSLAWSPVGIGIHKRHVLAVLTTNLLLSIWESTGKPGSWRRVCIINKSLSMDHEVLRRKKQRIRAFAWLPALQVSTDARQDRQYLAVVNDKDDVVIFHITANHSTHIRSFETTIVFEIKLTEQELSTENLSPLQKFLQTPPISKIQCGKLQKLMDEDGAVSLLRMRITFERGPTRLKCGDLVLSCEPSQNDLQLYGHIAPHVALTKPTVNVPTSSDFGPALSQPMDDFKKQHGLHGDVRIRYWGFARSPDGTTDAMCVSFHLLDDTRVISREAEQCVVVFKPNEVAALNGNSAIANPKLELLRWIVGHCNVGSIKTDLDAKIMRVAAASIKMAFVLDTGLMEWSRAAQGLAASIEPASHTERETHHFVSAPTVAESCEICDSAISISRNLCSGRCAQGHTFARCGVSLLAIQEPGISKYCSRCGKQFLDILKLEPQEGPSLSLSLFGEFDVCPYCRGKFRG